MSYEGVSKKITNGSKTAVMDVTGFLCVSLGNEGHAVAQLIEALCYKLEGHGIESR
jgi:hypothetical protein